MRRSLHHLRTCTSLSLVRASTSAEASACLIRSRVVAGQAVKDGRLRLRLHGAQPEQLMRLLSCSQTGRRRSRPARVLILQHALKRSIMVRVAIDRHSLRCVLHARLRSISISLHAIGAIRFIVDEVNVEGLGLGRFRY